jgi:hypothetical protein
MKPVRSGDAKSRVNRRQPVSPRLPLSAAAVQFRSPGGRPVMQDNR